MSHGHQPFTPTRPLPLPLGRGPGIPYASPRYMKARSGRQASVGYLAHQSRSADITRRASARLGNDVVFDLGANHTRHGRAWVRSIFEVDDRFRSTALQEHDDEVFAEPLVARLPKRDTLLRRSGIRNQECAPRWCAARAIQERAGASFSPRRSRRPRWRTRSCGSQKSVETYGRRRIATGERINSTEGWLAQPKLESTA